MPKTSHPMAMLDTAILTMENESAFRKAYTKGVHKMDYWESTLEDAMRVMGTIHTIAAGVYRIRYKKGALIKPSPKLDWAADYARMLGLPPKAGKTAMMMRLYLTLHCDHEGGNVSANTCHTVGSALSDAFYAVSAGLNGLAGPLHGLANQECLGWVLQTMEKFGGAPSEKQIEEYAWETLNGGKVIPGYGHAVLRVTDPRFTAFNAFGKKYMKNDPVFQTVDRVFKIVPKGPQEARQGQESVAERRRRFRCPAVLLRPEGIRVLHRAVLGLPCHGHAVSVGAQPRPGYAHHAAEIGQHQVALERSQGQEGQEISPVYHRLSQGGPPTGPPFLWKRSRDNPGWRLPFVKGSGAAGRC